MVASDASVVTLRRMKSDSEVQALLDVAFEKGRRAGIKEERARIIRCRNECLRHVRVNDEALAGIACFDGMIVRGEDPAKVAA